MNEVDERVDETWTQSLRDVLRDVIRKLPDRTTLGELVDATRSSDHLAPVLEVFTVQELIDVAKERPRPDRSAPSPAPASNGGIQYDAEGNPLLDLADLGPAVIRRRADIPGGDLLVLQALARNKAGRRETELLQGTALASDQLRLVLRHLRTKGHVHLEGSGPKRRYKITRVGTAFLRKAGYAE
ncbi:MAG: hypothetical protein R3B09_17155 [Nannocystaceae bacterium]